MGAVTIGVVVDEGAEVEEEAGVMGVLPELLVATHPSSQSPLQSSTVAPFIHTIPIYPDTERTPIVVPALVIFLFIAAFTLTDFITTSIIPLIPIPNPLHMNAIAA